MHCVARASSIAFHQTRVHLFARYLSSKRGSMLADDPKYSWLKEIGITGENDGAFIAGKWCGSGEVIVVLSHL
jgi:hypothetical protein